MNQVKRAKVLVVDDDSVVLKAVTQILQREGHPVVAIDDAVEGLTAAKDPSIDVVVLDIKMPNLSGMDLLRGIKADRPDVEVIMMTAFATVETAVEAVKAGAYDYLTKPFENIDEVSLTVAKAAERKALKDRTRALEEALTVRSQFEDLIGQSPQMRSVFKLVETVSHSTATVLIQGESGTGKELVARAIHYRSSRKDKPFVAVNCSALTETLLESELFGHIKGSFTGATGNKKGLFEAADGGTIFLDEIGDVPPATQVRLLRVLQEGEVKRVGANEPVKVDVRVIAATHVDLSRAKEQGKFREDLFYRLNVITIDLPPLRDRPQDVPLLAHHFLKLYASKADKKVAGISPRAMEALTCNRWTGNVRELENVIERAVVLTSNEVIDVEDLPPGFQSAPQADSAVEVFSLAHLPYAQAKRLAMRAFERRYLSALLEKNNQNVSSAARAAGVDRSNFRRLLKQYEVAGRSMKPRVLKDDDVDGVETLEAAS
ncbi:sigma-54-dependent Fis family transcriptional regulator [Myxococcus sp. CA051A]|uniref:Sigma-54-dependent Fis family transcriptional regulator n=1 Tax=Myxococcus llanfairpwllgwyngyllgogerychwyrndrobwllllantysiliogogogochensis TaxID=2590453 RepID=A0A540X810_9BACT|nr:sigma-54 dependent transcriptional regulator [Myxococcus llanfairpwllgwyngyllgogerychwyrndrobwllllantysiliogogogochensis]NTX00962.1 sigma-54-dependent Fis family transcriptional regulator [Myxococcus sp. CA040A]NTX12332.1 sigma-54-dependent Fis family transcriptional regulator [Myxococcus sp. CA056]NTX33349.1 sigma-54-dependent Fis family transcriptional regulator [Myxococcus sp. CA033]NTX52519.1 sigma-54-dependent Fis family transcriptional regulator [Myxococcus sp. CA039A]NTX59587.1 sigma